MPKPRSRYDELHDRYHAIATTKSGTRYERLAALVFKALEERQTVIHDLKLVGEDPDVKHQIDVTIELPGEKARRLLIECKDFDISGSPVGLDIIRNFRSVIEDTGADQGIVLTCNGFTDDAQKYAKSKNIKLVVLRIFETEDMKGRIAKIVLRFIVEARIPEKANLYIDAESDATLKKQLAAAGISRPGIAISDPVYFLKGSARVQFCEHLSRCAAQPDQWKQTTDGALAMPSDGWQIQVGQMPPVDYKGIVLDIRDERAEEVREITSKRVAELILTGFQDSDLIIFGDQIANYAIDPDTGQVVKN